MDESLTVSAGHMESITTRDTVEIRLGMLEFRDRAPVAETAEPLYPRLDFVRGGEAFLSGYQGARSIACGMSS